jgi:hypothetical protein
MAKEQVALNFSELVDPNDHCHLPVPGTFRVFLYPSDHTEDFPPIAWEIVSVDTLTLRKLCQDDKVECGSQFF